MSVSLKPAVSGWQRLSSLEIPRSVRALVRARESGLALLGGAIGALAGLVVAAMAWGVSELHRWLFAVPAGERLSALTSLEPLRAVMVPLVGGLIFGLALMALARWRPTREVDPIEANALHGGRMSLVGSISVALQTVWSSGVGASVGLEAGYTQLASGFAARFGQAFRLRRRDLRVLVGCGAAGAIAGAFGAPLAGAFYAFELIIGSYSVATLAPVGMAALIGYLVVKLIAPVETGILAPALTSGFRGGLFFASLLLGALGGHLFAAGLSALWPALALDPGIYAIIGMGALSVSVVGGPLTMTFIALETTGNLWLTTAVVIAVIIAAQVTREAFGYSFATWRFHLRGETIRSAADIGWMRDLTVEKMMRADVETIKAAATIGNFRESYPLGSTCYVVAVDDLDRYVGLVLVAEAHGADVAPERAVKELLHFPDEMLLPEMAVKEAVLAFDRAEAEALVVVDSFLDRRVAGLLTEAYVLRRYAAALEGRRRDLVGE